MREDVLFIDNSSNEMEGYVVNKLTVSIVQPGFAWCMKVNIVQQTKKNKEKRTHAIVHH
jgi:hypothetical protein